MVLVVGKADKQAAKSARMLVSKIWVVALVVAPVVVLVVVLVVVPVAVLVVVLVACKAD